jgi:hypothetical protein
MKPTTLIYPIVPAVHKRLTFEWESLRTQAREKGIELARDGSFTGRATGRVTVSHDRVSVLITDKPWIVPMAAIDAELKRLFS